MKDVEIVEIVEDVEIVEGASSRIFNSV